MGSPMQVNNMKSRSKARREREIYLAGRLDRDVKARFGRHVWKVSAPWTPPNVRCPSVGKANNNVLCPHTVSRGSLVGGIETMPCTRKTRIHTISNGNLVGRRVLSLRGIYEKSEIQCVGCRWLFCAMFTIFPQCTSTMQRLNYPANTCFDDK